MKGSSRTTLRHFVFYSLGILLMLNSCSPENQTTTRASSSNPPSSESNPIFPDPPPNPADAVYGNECRGDRLPATGTNLSKIDPILIRINGRRPWFPSEFFGRPDSQSGEGGMAAKFGTDSRLQFQIKVEPDPGRYNCTFNDLAKQVLAQQQAGMRAYQVLKMDVHAITYNDETGTWSRAPLQTFRTGPVSVGRCSPVFEVDLNNLQNVGVVYLAIDNVRSDSQCSLGGYYAGSYAQQDICPAEIKVRTTDCWSASLYISTDFTVPLR